MTPGEAMLRAYAEMLTRKHLGRRFIVVKEDALPTDVVLLAVTPAPEFFRFSQSAESPDATDAA